MAIFDSIFNFAVSLLSQTGYLGIFFLMVLESATLPVPSEIVLPLAGFLVFQGRVEFWTAVIVATFGSLVGTMIDYAIGFYLGRGAIIRYGKAVKLSEKHLLLSEKWFNRYGPIIVLLARFVPLIRTLVAFPAGIAKMNVLKFLVYSTIGIFAWDALLIYLGLLAGQNSQSIIDNLHSIFTYVGVAAVVLAAVFVAFRWRKTRLEPVQEEKKIA